MTAQHVQEPNRQADSAMLEKLEDQRNTAWQELREIRLAINADESESTADEVRRVVAQRDDLLKVLQRLSAQCERLRLPGQPETDAEKTARAVIAKATGGAA